MNKTIKIILITLILTSIFVVAQDVVCNKPYILVGSACCLDKDGNSICDIDEGKILRTAYKPPKNDDLTNLQFVNMYEEKNKIPWLWLGLIGIIIYFIVKHLNKKERSKSIKKDNNKEHKNLSKDISHMKKYSSDDSKKHTHSNNPEHDNSKIKLFGFTNINTTKTNLGVALLLNLMLPGIGYFVFGKKYIRKAIITIIISILLIALRPLFMIFAIFVFWDILRLLIKNE